ncbi:alkaline phosphatase [Sphingobacterium sp. UT-1RO-CII-1]|uniref:alkaline phosphatase n=1 Tax=Sphingobacterium sp. UT-1RO-CII-1 TaxID=2995225 RepID=UPI00227C01F3|nr:alkaline phosphatase [Sphingobacterium sp. UT-1RO-CII-1]MCY4780269.1 alkaline phosphatase [Sphingobacterium sp. UT-1RO-CII-1]
MRKIVIHLMILMLCTLAASAQFKKVKHIVVIGCDGFGGYALPQADMPNVKKLMQTGAWSLQARSVLPSSSAVNWASMLMGASPTLHGYTEWGSQEPEIPSAVKHEKYNKFPSIFSVIRDQKPKAVTAAIYSWPGIGYLLEKEAITTVFSAEDNEDVCVDKAVDVILKDKPSFTFVHFDEPDHTGHSEGHKTAAYYAVLKEVDARIGKIVDAVNKAGIAEETIILVTSDHGGIDKGHGGKSLDEVQVPWIISGPGIKKNTELKSTIVAYDTAATIATILGLEQPQAWRGKAVTEAFSK